jgi:ketosteroid isomerase-like protein
MSTEQDVRTVRDIVRDRVDAMRNGDAPTICSAYAPGAVVFNLAPPLRQPDGSAQDVAAQQAWFDDKGGSVWIEMRDVDVRVAGDLAVVTALESMGSRPGAPEQFTLWYRTTLVYARGPQGWLIVHEHSSTPFHMDGSLRAAVDLQP